MYEYVGKNNGKLVRRKRKTKNEAEALLGNFDNEKIFKITKVKNKTHRTRLK